MLELQWYGMLYLLPLPWLARWWLKPAAKKVQQTLFVPFINDFQRVLKSPKNITRKNKGLFALTLLAWLFFVLALAKPIQLGEAITVPVSARNILLAVDLSGSMQQRDFTLKGKKVSRLTATKKVALDFIARRDSDRIGLILFGDQAYLQTPLTRDRQTVAKLLSEAELGLAGERTALGDAIGLAIKRVQQHSAQSYVLVLMTDGEATIGADVHEAAKIAATIGLKIYTVGIGSPLKKKRYGRSALDEKTLKYIAKVTSGQYFRARNTTEFSDIYQQLDVLEPVVRETEQWRPHDDLFHWPLAAAIFLIVLVMSIRKVMEIND